MILAEYKSSKMDTTRVLLLINIGQQYEGTNPETAKKYYKEAEALSEKLNYKRGILKFISNFGYVLNMQGKYDESLKLNLKSVQISKEIGDSLALAKCLFNTGTSYQLNHLIMNLLLQNLPIFFKPFIKNLNAMIKPLSLEKKLLPFQEKIIWNMT